jgi:hypothetical protein
MSALVGTGNGWKAPQSTARALGRRPRAGSEPTPSLRTGPHEYQCPVVRPLRSARLLSLNVNDPGTNPGRSDNPCALAALDAQQRD